MIILKITTKKVNQEHVIALGQRSGTYFKHIKANQD